jgi:outer membrane protein
VKRIMAAAPIALLWVAAAAFAAERAAPDSAAAARPITVAEAVSLARSAAPLAIQAAGQRRSTAAAVRSSYAAFLPNVTLSAGATRQYPTRGGGTRVENGQVITLPDQPWSYSGAFGANVELFAGGKRLFDLKEARANASVATTSEVAQGFAVALDVKQKYYNVLAARESEIAARAQIEQAEFQWRSALARVSARSATRSDSLRAEIQRRNAQLALVDALTSTRAAEAALTRAVGTPYPVTAAPEDSLDRPSLALSEEEIRSLAAEGPAVREARSRLTAARAVSRAAWTGYLPSVNASYSRSASGTGGTFGLGADSYDYSGALRLSVSLPLFNQLGREEQVVRASVAEDNAVADLRDARLGATESFTRSWGAYRSAEQRVTAQAASVEAAEEDLRVQQQRYSLGSATLLDVLTSQAQLDQARQDLIRARYDQRVAKAELEALVGREL